MGRIRTQKTKGPSFFKIMLGDFSERLQIPAPFVKRFFDGVPQKVWLYCLLSEKRWSVKVKEQGNGTVLFQEGWNKFVQDHSLEEGEFLVFYYNYRLGFSVDLYGRNGCRKTVDMVAKKTKEQSRKHREERIEDGEIEGGESMIDLIEEHARHCGSSGRDNNSKVVSLMTISDSTDSEMETTTIKGGRQLSDKRKIKTGMGKRTEGKEVEVAMRAASFKPKNPFFMVVMRPSYITKYQIHVPMSFVNNYLPDDQEVTIRMSDGRSWSVKYRRDSSPKFYTGWRRFVAENDVKAGDICTFELIDAVNKIFYVRICSK